MKNITSNIKNMKTITLSIVIAIGLAFVVLPIFSQNNTAVAYEDDWVNDFGGGYGMITEGDAGGAISYHGFPTGFDFASQGDAGGTIGDPQVAITEGDAGGAISYHGFPTGFDFASQGDAGGTIGDPQVAITEGDAGGTIGDFRTPTDNSVRIEQTVREYAYGVSGGYYGGSGYSYGSYGYGVPTASYGNYAYTSPTYSYATPTYTQSPNPTCSLTVSDDNVDEDDEVTLRWSTTNATAVSINGGVGTVGTSGSREVTIDDTTNFVLVASGQGGTIWCTELVTVDEDEDNDSDVRCDSFRSSEDEVEDGDRVTLTWRTTGADSVRINEGIGSVDDDGDRSVRITEDTTFVLTARDGNDSDTCRVTVEVEDEDDEENPRCRLTISDRTPSVGERVTLSWENERADRLTIRDNNGNTIADSRNDRNLDEDRDSITVTPRVSTEYTLTVYNGDETRTCRVSAEVNGIVVTSIRSQDTIELSSVPYTGFEAGTVLTIIFYSAIVLWGVGIAYVLLRRKEAGVTDHAVYAAHVVMPEVSVHAETVPSNLPTEDGMTQEVVTEGSDDITALEAYAHDHGALISSDALRFIASEGNGDALALLERVIGLAKARFPKENDWVVINKERVLTILS